MDNVSEGQESVKYSTTRAWWAPSFLLVLLLPKQIHSSHLWWWLVDAAVVSVALLILYVLTHPILTFSPLAITQRRGPFRVRIDLNDLQSVRINVTQRRTNVIDPQTGERRSVVRFNFKSLDDWAGKPPVQGFYVSDSNGHHLTLSVLQTGASQWGTYLLRAIKAQSEVDVGPRVVEALEYVTR